MKINKVFNLSNRPVTDQPNLYDFTLPAKLLQKSLHSEKKSASLRDSFNLQRFNLNSYKKQNDKQLADSLKSHQESIAKHMDAIANPAAHAEDWNERNEYAKKGLINWWEKEVKNLRKQIDIIKGEQERRKNKSHF